MDAGINHNNRKKLAEGMSKSMGKSSQTRAGCMMSVALLLTVFSCHVSAAANYHAQIDVQPSSAASDEGIRFTCNPGRLAAIDSAMETYLASLGITPAMVVKKMNASRGMLVYSLNTPKDDTDTLDLKNRPAFHIRNESITLPARHGKQRTVQTVSKKEIVLALLQHGRLTEFRNDACDLQALADHVALRQNIVAWSENLNWNWTDGGKAKWNRQFWNRGTPQPGIPLHAALNDAFFNQGKYAIGCYTATKLVMMQGVMDYYRRVRHDPARQALVENRLLADNEPLLNIEPGIMWYFEKDFDPAELDRPGKLLRIVYGIAAGNFVPGDWIYILNTDPVSYRKTGYEGSNAIYLGRNKFDDYYNDHHHAYTFRQKMNEVFQWRNGVFNRIRDAAKAKPLSAQDLERLSMTPAQGGILTDIRVFPYYFGYEALPVRLAPATAATLR